MQDELPTKIDQGAEVVEKLARPQLIAILFCDWVNRTENGKINLIGAFDRIFIGSEPRVTPPFTLFVRVAQALEGPTQVRAILPNGEIGFVATLEPDAEEQQQDRKQQQALHQLHVHDQQINEPAFVQIIGRVQFEAKQEGIYWFDVSHQGVSLGGAPLVVRFVEQVQSDHEGAEAE